MTRARSKGSASSRRERRAFSLEFKQEAVRLVHERRAAGVGLNQLGRELDVRPDQLRTWARQLMARPSAAPGSGALESPEQELRRLRRENAVLRQEQEFAKKVAVYFAKESR
jgi:transposase